jgi:hypothetical protein
VRARSEGEKLKKKTREERGKRGKERKKHIQKGQ